MDYKHLVQQGYRYALALTHNPALAEDLLHDAWESMLSISAPRNTAYLYKSIRNKFLNHRKRENILPFVSFDETLSEDELIASESAFSELVADQQLMEKILAELNSIERELIYLYYFEEYTTQEIAEIVGHSKGTVCSLIFRARKKLKDFLESDISAVAL